MRSFASPGFFALASSAIVFVGLGALLYWMASPSRTDLTGEPIIVYCADAVRVPLEAVRDRYESETGQKVELRVNSSQGLLAQLEISKDADLFLPADDSFVTLARGKNWIRETLPLATMTAVVVANAEARSIASWSDFVNPDVELILANPDAAAIGKLTRAVLTPSGRWAEVEKRKPVFQAKISEVGSAVTLNPRGAGILFDAVATQFPKLIVTRLPELEAARANIAVAVTSFSKQPTLALHFARYLTAKDRGLEEFAARGYRVSDIADVFVDRPELRLFGGTMLRPAIEETLKEFAAREGIELSTNWNGCGILVGEMLTNKIPDIYFACEPRFMEKVQASFQPPELVSQNRLVIAVEKGNPHGIQALKDLGQDGLKVGVGNENQCALGDLTKQTFIRTGLYGRVRKNIAKEAPSGDLLISDFRTKALNVIVCYESNVTPYLHEMDFVPIDIGASNQDCTNPLQPVAIAKACRHPQLARRLLDALQSPESREKFEALGFGWVSTAKSPS